jgi:drug/metabolite transporter (DMT)-like permease
MTQQRPQDVQAAMLWMGGALVGLILLGLAGRELSREIGPAETVVFRSGVAVVLFIPYLLVAGWRRVATSQLRWHAFRSTTHFCGQWCWFYAIGLIPLAEVFAIEFTSPIWTALFAATFLRERITALRALAITLCFVGVLVVIRPGLVEVHDATLVALLAAVCTAANYTITRSMTRTEPVVAIVFYMNLLQLPMGLALCWNEWITPSPGLWPWAVIVGVSGMAAHFCIARALVTADAALVAPLDFLRVPLIALVAYLVYDEALNPFVGLGAAIILAGNWLNLRAARPIASR